jgi:hypothetical protein
MTNKQTAAEPEPTWDVKPDIDFTNPTQALATRQTESIEQYRMSEDSEGEWDQQDSRIPRLSLIHPMDQRAIARQFMVGDYVYNSQVALKQPIPLVVIKMTKKYIEKIDKDENPKAIERILSTASEVRALGGTLDYDAPPGKIPFQDMCDALVLFGQKENDLGLFPFEFDGQFWCPALYRMRGSAYTRAAVTWNTARSLNLRDGLINGRWTLESKTENINDRPTQVPFPKFNGRNSAEFVAFIKEITDKLI